jgi:hypothetical protein
MGSTRAHTTQTPQWERDRAEFAALAADLVADEEDVRQRARLRLEALPEEEVKQHLIALWPGEQRRRQRRRVGA